MDERPHLEVCGRIPASSLDLEGQWNGASAVEEGQGEESVVSSSEAWHCGDADDLSSSHGHLFANQTMFVFVKKEPGDVPPTSTGENAHPDDSGNMSEFPLQVERHSDSGIVVKKETSESAFVRADEGSCPGASDSVPSLQVHLCGLWNEGQLSVIEVPDEILPTPTRDGIHVEESDRASPFRSVLEERWDNNCAVKEGKLSRTVNLDRPMLKSRAQPDSFWENVITPYALYSSLHPVNGLQGRKKFFLGQSALGAWSALGA